MDKAHGVDSSVFRTSGNVSGHGRRSTPCGIRIAYFHTVLKHVPWHVFDRLVDAHGADARVRRLSTRDQFIALLYGQLAGAQSLREIEAGLASHAHRLYHLGARAISRSTLADANAKRPSEAFGALFAHLVAQAGRGLRRKIGEAVHLIDSTGLRLSDLSADWARFSDGVCGAKLHIVYDCDAERPIDAAITPARLNDITAAQALPIAAGATYVFDLGYYDFVWWARLDDAGCRIVTWFKSNTCLTVVAENRDGPDPPGRRRRHDDFAGHAGGGGAQPRRGRSRSDAG